jgi:hypothetical protein
MACSCNLVDVRSAVLEGVRVNTQVGIARDPFPVSVCAALENEPSAHILPTFQTEDSPDALEDSIPRNSCRTAIRQAMTKRSVNAMHPPVTKRIRLVRERRVIASVTVTSVAPQMKLICTLTPSRKAPSCCVPVESSWFPRIHHWRLRVRKVADVSRNNG